MCEQLFTCTTSVTKHIVTHMKICMRVKSSHMWKIKAEDIFEIGYMAHNSGMYTHTHTRSGADKIWVQFKIFAA